MKFSALSVIAILALFAETMAEPIPLTILPIACPDQVYHCEHFLSSFNPLMNYLCIWKALGHV